MKKTIFCIAMMLVTTTIFAAKQTVNLVVEQMECGNCQAKVEKVLAYEKGVKDLVFDLEHRTVIITFDDAKTDVKTLQRVLLKDLKYKSRVLTNADEKPHFHHTCDHQDEHNHGTF